MSRLIYLDQGLALVPASLRRIVEKVDPSRYDERLATDRFTLREAIAHVADMEPVLRWRMELAAESPGSPVPNFDQDEEAIAKNYAAWEVGPTLDTLAEERAKTMRVYRSFDETQLKLCIVHPILGEVSIFDLAVFLLGHDMYHLDQASAYL